MVYAIDLSSPPGALCSPLSGLTNESVVTRHRGWLRLHCEPSTQQCVQYSRYSVLSTLHTFTSRECRAPTVIDKMDLSQPGRYILMHTYQSKQYSAGCISILQGGGIQTKIFSWRKGRKPKEQENISYIFPSLPPQRETFPLHPF